MYKMHLIQNEEELAKALHIRDEVFVKEQDIPLNVELDGNDEGALHILVHVDNLPIATGRLRILPAGKGNMSRIAVLAAFRGRGLGKRVVLELEALARQQGVEIIFLYPHHYLEGFYQALGYQKTGENYAAGRHSLIKMEKNL